MARVRKVSDETITQPMRPALTPEAREQQLIALATNLVEQRLRDGTASSQETTHFLKLATSKYKAEVKGKELENELTAAKTKAIEDGVDMKVLYAEAIRAMQVYSGRGDRDDYDE